MLYCFTIDESFYIRDFNWQLRLPHSYCNNYVKNKADVCVHVLKTRSNTGSGWGGLESLDPFEIRIRPVVPNLWVSTPKVFSMSFLGVTMLFLIEIIFNKISHVCIYCELLYYIHSDDFVKKLILIISFFSIL